MDYEAFVDLVGVPLGKITARTRPVETVAEAAEAIREARAAQVTVCEHEWQIGRTLFSARWGQRCTKCNDWKGL
jgi:hypothetical protein